jgi:hypothetical protein
MHRAFRAYSVSLPGPTWNRQGQTKNCCGGGAVECAARAEPRSGDASSSNRNVSCRSSEPARNGSLGHRMASRRCRRRTGRGHLVARRHDVVQDDGDGTPPLAAGTVDNTCLIKNLLRQMIVTWRLKFPVRCVQIPCSFTKIPCSNGSIRPSLINSWKMSGRFFRCRLILPAIILNNAEALALLSLHHVWGGLLGFMRRRLLRLVPGHFGR